MSRRKQSNWPTFDQQLEDWLSEDARQLDELLAEMLAEMRPTAAEIEEFLNDLAHVADGASAGDDLNRPRPSGHGLQATTRRTESWKTK